MKHAHLFVLVACSVALIAAGAGSAAADEPSGRSIVYRDAYKKLIAAFPAGSADDCDIHAVLNGAGGMCDARIDAFYFNPDGTWGGRPWHPDASSSSGWSIQPDPCVGLTGEESQSWASYVDYHNGYFDSGPDLTAEQVDRYGACWGWWF